MTRIAIVAPASFGEAATAYLGGATRALAGHPATSRLIEKRRELEQAVAQLGDGDVVLGSLGSELAAEVAQVASDRGLVHVEAGAVNDEALGKRSFRLTAAKGELARAAATLAGDRRVGIIFEPSAFGRAMWVAVRAELAARAADVAVETELDDVVVDPSAWHEHHRVEVVVAALRGALPERLLAALAQRTGSVMTVIGAGGSWTRPEIGHLASLEPGFRLVFCEVVAPRSRVVANGGWHMLYGDLGHAAGEVTARALAMRRPVRDALARLVVDEHDSPLGYGVSFDSHGRNELARAVLLQWKNGALISYKPGGGV